jgi:hypothetical protein
MPLASQHWRHQSSGVAALNHWLMAVMPSASIIAFITAMPLDYRMSAVGCWLLAVGCWLLAVGCWLLANGERHSALVFGIRHSAFGIRHSAFGIRHSAFGIRHSRTATSVFY